jgi:hypothetical protein
MRIKCEKCGTINTGDFVSNCKCCGQRLQKQIEEYNDKLSKAKVNQVKIKGKDRKNEKETLNIINIKREEITASTLFIKIVMYLAFYDFIFEYFMAAYINFFGYSLAQLITPLLANVFGAGVDIIKIELIVIGFIASFVLQFLLVNLILHIICSKYVIEKDKIGIFTFLIGTFYVVSTAFLIWYEYLPGYDLALIYDISYKASEIILDVVLNIFAIALLIAYIRKVIIKKCAI